MPIGHNPTEAPKKVARVNREKLSLEAKNEAASGRFEAELQEVGSTFKLGQTIERIDSLGISHSWRVESEDAKGNLLLKREDDDIYEEPATRRDLALEQKALEINEITGVSALTEVEDRLKKLASKVKLNTGKDHKSFSALTLLDVAKELVQAKATGKIDQLKLDDKIIKAIEDEEQIANELTQNGEEAEKNDREKARRELKLLKDLAAGTMMDNHEHARLEESIKALSAEVAKDDVSTDEYPVLVDEAASVDKRTKAKRISAENIPDLESELEELPDHAIEGLQDEPTVAKQSPNPQLSTEQLDALAVKARAKRETAQEVRRAVSAREEAARNELAAKRAIDDRAEKVVAGDFLSLEENLKDLKNAESVNDRPDYSKNEKELIGDDLDGNFFAKEPVKLSADAIQALESPTPAFWAISESVPGDNRDYKDFIEQFEELRQAGQLKDFYGNEITLKRVQEAKKSLPFDWLWNRKHRADSIRYLRETVKDAMEKSVPLADQLQTEAKEDPATIGGLRARLGKWGGRVLAGLGLMTQIENDTPQRPEPSTRERIVNAAELPPTRQEVTPIDLGESRIAASQSATEKRQATTLKNKLNELKSSGEKLRSNNELADISVDQTWMRGDITERDAELAKQKRTKRGIERLAKNTQAQKNLKDIQRGQEQIISEWEKSDIKLAKVESTPSTERLSEKAKQARNKRGRESIAKSPEKQKIFNELPVLAEETAETLDDSVLSAYPPLENLAPAERERVRVESKRWKRGNELIKSIKDWTPESSLIELTGSEAEKLANNAESFNDLLSALNELPGTAEFKQLSTKEQKVEIGKAMRNIDALEKASRSSNLSTNEQRRLNSELEATHQTWQLAYDNANKDIRTSIKNRAAEKAEIERIQQALNEELE